MTWLHVWASPAMDEQCIETLLPLHFAKQIHSLCGALLICSDGMQVSFRKNTHYHQQ